MKNMIFHSPKTIDDALELLSQNQGCKVLAGGTDLVLQLREKKIKPEVLVDISNIAELHGVHEENGRIVIKSATTFSAVQASKIVCRKMPALIDACSVVGSPQIRNQSTLGGNIANASPAADSVPVLVLFDGSVRIASSRGVREMLISNLLTGPGKTKLAEDELITEILLQPISGSINSFYKLGRRNALAISRISSCIEMVFAEDTITAARVALGSVGPNPFRAAPLEVLLTGKKFSKELEEEFIVKTCEFTSERLGSRASATYKKEAIAGVMRGAWQQLATRREV